MGDSKHLRLLILVAAVYSAVYLAMQYNLAAKTAALAEQPVTIVVDAGHGGEDGGAVSQDGVRESAVNLSIALRLEQVLALCGMKPLMIRSADLSVCTEGDTVRARKVSDLKQRVRLTNEAAPAVLVSIHQNHFGDARYSGAQVFYAAAAGSRELAQLTQDCLRQTLDPDNRREIKKADTVYLLEQTNCTGILVECGFLSNAAEAALLQTPNTQTKIACAIGSALAQFLEEGKDIEI